MMSIDEKIQKMEGQIESMARETREASAKLDEVLIALRGSALAGDGGLVGRIAYLEKEIEAQEKRFTEEIVKIKEAANKSAVYQNILWTCAGAIATGIGLFLIKQILGK